LLETESISSRKKYRHKVLVIQIFSERNLTMRKKFFLFVLVHNFDKETEINDSWLESVNLLKY
jgi:hypothetical protein